VISAVARRYGVSRQTVHGWLRRYARAGAVLNLEDRLSRPQGVRIRWPQSLEARVLVLRDAMNCRTNAASGAAGISPPPSRFDAKSALSLNPWTVGLW